MRIGRIHPDKFLRYWQASHFLKQIFNSTEDLSVLDLGANENMLPRFVKQTRIHQLDLTRAAKAEKFIQADAGWLPFRDESFDGITALDLLEHTPVHNRKRILEEACRTSSRGVIFSFPNPDKSVVSGEKAFNALEKTVYGQSNRFLEEHRQHGMVDIQATEAILKQKYTYVTRISSFDIHGWILSYILEMLFGIHSHAPALRENLYLLLNHVMTRQADISKGYRIFLVASAESIAVEPPPPLRGLDEYEFDKLFESFSQDASNTFEQLKKLSEYAENLKDRVSYLEARITELGDENLRLTSDFVDLEIIYKRLEKSYRDLEIFSHKLERELSETKLSANAAYQERDAVVKEKDKSRAERRQLIDRINAMKNSLHEQEILIVRLQKLKTDHFSESHKIEGFSE